MIFIICTFVLSIVSCGQRGNRDNVTLTISAASSLREAMEDIKAEFEKENKEIQIVFNFGASGSLQKQIEQGAKVDVFLSAAVRQMELLEAQNLIIKETKKNFLQNRIVLIVPRDSNGINSFNDLLSSEVKLIGIGEPKSVPVGQYAKELLDELDMYEELNSKFVFGKDVKEVLTWVETGNVDAGIVYETDAKASKKAKIVVLTADDMIEPIYYPAAVLKESDNVDIAKAFIEFLYSDKARGIFEKYGFRYAAK
jgi:molybdate transport system substrate-binding protein